MSHNRYAKRIDTVQPSIVEGLRSDGFGVWIIGRPVDIIVHHPSWGRFMLPMEIKTGNGKVSAEQRAFIELTGCPVVRGLYDARSEIEIGAIRR